MHSGRPAIIFPEIRKKPIAAAVFSKDEIRSLCDIRPLSSLAGSIANYVVQKNRTGEMRKQYAAMSSAVDAEYTERERRAHIHFQEMTKQLKEDFRLKSETLKIKLREAEAEAESAWIEHKVAFDNYARTSAPLKEIFKILRQSASEIAKIIKYAENEDIAVNTRHYVKLCEHYRRLISGIEKYSKIIA